MTLEEVIEPFIATLPEFETREEEEAWVKYGAPEMTKAIVKAVANFLLSDEVVERAAEGIKYDVPARYSFKGQAHAALSSITGDE